MAVAARERVVEQPVDEGDLVEAVRRGDDRAFETLYERYRGRIAAYVYGMVADHGRAEDIAQEVFIAALRRLRASDQALQVKPWLYEIAKNACIDEYRRTRHAREVPLEDEQQREEILRLVSRTPTPDAAIESKQRLDDLRSAFRSLSETHHRILVLRELEGLSYSQIGDRLGISKPVVESTLFRARRRLGEEFEEIESGRRCLRVQQLLVANRLRPPSAVGLRERRLVSRHLAHCASCQRQASRVGGPLVTAVHAGVAVGPSPHPVATSIPAEREPRPTLSIPAEREPRPTLSIPAEREPRPTLSVPAEREPRPTLSIPAEPDSQPMLTVTRTIAG